MEMVKNKLAEDDVLQKGWLLDGYPRRRGSAMQRAAASAGHCLGGEACRLSRQVLPVSYPAAQPLNHPATIFFL